MGFSNEVEGRKLVAATTNFAFRLFNELSAGKNGGNVFLSPASINMALAMTYLGARKETANQMLKVLGFTDVSPDQLHSLFSELRQNLTCGGNCTLDIANKLYLHKEFTILQEFADSTSKFYDAASEDIDFGNVEGTRKTINEWVESKTKGKIAELLEEGALDTATRLILVNAVYFKGDWDNKFDPAVTKEEDFHLAEGGSVKVPLMHFRKNLDYGISEELKDVKALRLPYAGGKLSFVILLPEHPEGINDLEKSLTVEHISNFRQAFSIRPQTDVMVYLPRFKLEDTFNLRETLANQGMKDLFTTAADLSGIDGKRSLFVSNVIHKSFLELNEEGSEAAAATAVSLFQKLRPTMLFRADQPFLFFIRDDETGTVLFLGKYACPN